MKEFICLAIVITEYVLVVVIDVFLSDIVLKYMPDSYTCKAILLSTPVQPFKYPGGGGHNYAIPIFNLKLHIFPFLIANKYSVITWLKQAW